MGLLLGATYTAIGTLVGVFLGALVGLEAPWWAWAILVALIGRIDRALDVPRLTTMLATAGAEMEELRGEVDLLRERVDEIEGERDTGNSD